MENTQFSNIPPNSTQQQASSRKLLKYIIPLIIAGILVAGYFVLAKNQSWWPFEEQGYDSRIENQIAEYRGDGSSISEQYKNYIYFSTINKENSTAEIYFLPKDRISSFVSLLDIRQGNKMKLSGTIKSLGVGLGSHYWLLVSDIKIEPLETNTPAPTSTQTIVSNIFTYKSKPGDKVGGMVLSKINHPTSQTEPASPDYVYAEFTGTIAVTGRLSAPTGNPEDAGMGPEYSLNNLIQDSLKRLPYLQSDTRTVWFGVKNPDVMKNFSVKNGDLVEMTITKYEYVFFPAGVWNQADVVTVKKIQ